MTWPERVLLYGIVVGLQPRRVLEIGTHKGGSAMVIVAALDDLGAGKLICVDPQDSVAPEDWKTLAHRATKITGSSPEALSAAAEAAGGLFDFVLIDGDHLAPGVARDIDGTMSVLAPGGYMLFHDAYYTGVAEAIEAGLWRHRNLIDCGMLSTQPTVDNTHTNILWGGLRLMRSRP